MLLQVGFETNKPIGGLQTPGYSGIRLELSLLSCIVRLRGGSLLYGVLVVSGMFVPMNTPLSSTTLHRDLL
jgi:hypothetical protein